MGVGDCVNWQYDGFDGVIRVVHDSGAGGFGVGVW